MEFAKLTYIDKPNNEELFGKIRRVDYHVNVFYPEDGKKTKSIDLNENGDIFFYNSNSIKTLKLKYIRRQNFKDNFTKIVFKRKNKADILLNSSKLVKSEICKVDNSKNYSLYLEYLIKGPFLKLNRYFGVDSLSWLKLSINIKSKKRKLLNNFYNFSQNNLKSQSHNNQKRCDNCDSLQYKYVDGFSSFSCPTCLFMLSETTKNLEHATNAIRNNKLNKNLTEIHLNILKRIDGALQKCISLGTDTPILVLSFLRGKIFTLTETHFDEGLQNLEKLHQLSRSDLERGDKFLPPDFHDKIIDTLTKTYFQKQQFETALKVAQERFKFNEMRKNVFKTVSSLNSMAEILMAMKKYGAAQTNLEQSWKLQFQNNILGNELKDSEKMLRKIHEIRNQGNNLDKFRTPNLD